jgi:hypothetical protein
MKRLLVVALAVTAFLGVLSPPVFAQAPAPKVTINGLIDTVSTGGRNSLDGNFAAAPDSGWWVRNRGVFTITGEVGKAKGVLALEIDLGWGQVSGTESVNTNSGQTLTASSSQIGSPQNGFHQGAFDLGNDVGGVIEVKNLYVEFPMPIAIPWTMRLGGQPFQVTMKPGVLATTDYGGAWSSIELAPFAKLNFTYAQAEEQVTGMRASNTTFWRGDDFLVVVSLDLTPVKGITIRPLVGYFDAQGNTNAFSRCRVQCAGLPSNGAATGINSVSGAVTTSTLGSYRTSTDEQRVYWGVDAQINVGPFYVDPTIIVMNSTVDGVYRGSAEALLVGAAGTQGGGARVDQDIDSWLVDIRGGFRAGPLLIEAMVVWTPGDDAQHDSFKDSKLYHPINVDIGYGAGWTEILSLGSVDYFTNAGHGMGENIGLGRYGRRQVGARASYALTPALTLSGKWASAWTDTDVDTDAVAANLAGTSYGATPCALTGGIGGGCALSTNNRGDENYIGTEFSAGLTYRFAPGLTFDLVGAWLFAGSALDTTFVNPAGTTIKQDAKDAHLLAARVRYQF